VPEAFGTKGRDDRTLKGKKKKKWWYFIYKAFVASVGDRSCHNEKKKVARKGEGEKVLRFELPKPQGGGEGQLGRVRLRPSKQ